MLKCSAGAIALVFFGLAVNAETPTYAVEGTVVPARTWNVSPEMNNKINRIHFVEGQNVSKGDLLVQFDTGFKQMELDLSEAELGQAAVALEKAQVDFSRQDELWEREAISEAAHLDAQFALRKAEADFQVLKAKRDIAVGLLSAQRLHAPFDGFMTAPKFAENTNVITVPGAEVTTLIQLDPIHVRGFQPLDQVMERLLAGEATLETAAKIRATLQLPNGETYAHEGHVVSWSVGLDEEVNQKVVIAEFPNPDHILRPGMKVTMTGVEN